MFPVPPLVEDPNKGCCPSGFDASGALPTLPNENAVLPPPVDELPPPKMPLPVLLEVPNKGDPVEALDEGLPPKLNFGASDIVVTGLRVRKSVERERKWVAYASSPIAKVCIDVE